MSLPRLKFWNPPQPASSCVIFHLGFFSVRRSKCFVGDQTSNFAAVAHGPRVRPSFLFEHPGPGHSLTLPNHLLLPLQSLAQIDPRLTAVLSALVSASERLAVQPATDVVVQRDQAGFGGGGGAGGEAPHTRPLLLRIVHLGLREERRGAIGESYSRIGVREAAVPPPRVFFLLQNP